jgi:3',5'-cyclic AMP phosphodiesterase CpdA
MSDPRTGDAPANRFAFLADPHLTTLDAVRVRELLNKRLLSYLSWNRHRHASHSRAVLDTLTADLAAHAGVHTIIGGDLTNLGTPGECFQALTWLRGIGAPSDVTVVPGNHDLLVPARWAHTVALWRDYMSGDDTAAGPEHLPFMRRRGDVALIGVNTARPTAPLLASGRIGAAALHRLEWLLQNAARQGLCRVVVMHHPPTANAVNRRRALDDGDALRRVLRRVGAELILHGHAHTMTIDELPGPHGAIPVVSAPPASSTADDARYAAGYYLFDVARDEDSAHARWSIRMTARSRDARSARFRTVDEQVPRVFRSSGTLAISD